MHFTSSEASLPKMTEYNVNIHSLTYLLKFHCLQILFIMYHDSEYDTLGLDNLQIQINSMNFSKLFLLLFLFLKLFSLLFQVVKYVTLHKLTVD